MTPHCGAGVAGIARIVAWAGIWVRVLGSCSSVIVLLFCDALKKAVLKKHKPESGPETFTLNVNCSVTPNSAGIIRYRRWESVATTFPQLEPHHFLCTTSTLYTPTALLSSPILWAPDRLQNTLCTPMAVLISPDSFDPNA
jgi:hypothetical protein